MKSRFYIWKKNSIQLGELLFPDKGRLQLVCIHRIFRLIGKSFLQFGMGFRWERGFFRGHLEEKALQCVSLTWTREHLGNKGDNIYWSHTLFQAASQLSLYTWKVSAEEVDWGLCVASDSCHSSDKSCHSPSAYRAPGIVIDGLQHHFQQCNNQPHLSSSDYVLDPVQSLFLGPSL